MLIYFMLVFLLEAQQTVNNFTVKTNLTVNGSASIKNASIDVAYLTAPLSATGNYWSFGDSQTAGANAAVTNYTSSGAILSQYRYPNLISASLSLNLTNLGKGGSSHSYNTGSEILRQTPINRFGANVSANWTGLATLMIGYNNINLFSQMSNFPAFYQSAQEAFVSRALIDGWAGVGSSGKDNTGTTWASFSTTGSQLLSGFTDDCVFPIGNPGTDQRTRIELTGTETYGITLTNKVDGFVYFDAHVNGGLAYVYTNGGFAGQIDSSFAALGPDSSPSSFGCVLRLLNISGSTAITITNVSGTNYILGVGFVSSRPVTGRTIVVGSPVRSYIYGEPYTAEIAMVAATQRAVSMYATDYPVYYADVNSRMIPLQDMDIQDRDHLNISGNLHVYEAFQNPIRPFGGYDYGQAPSILHGTYTAKASGTNLFGVSKLNSRMLVVGDFEQDNTEKAILGIASPSSVVGEVGFFQGGLDVANQTWAIRQNATTNPLLRFVKYSGGSAAGAVMDLNYSDLSVSIGGAFTNSGRATFGEHIVQSGSAPIHYLNSTGAKSIIWQTNSVDTFKLEALSSDTLLRFVVTDISGSAAGTALQIYRSGQVRMPLAVTNESTTSLQGAVTVGLTSTLGRLTIQSASGVENRVIWASGATATNRAHAGMVTHDIWRLTALDAAGTSTAFVPIQVDVLNGNVTSGGTRWTNTAIATFSSATPPILKAGVNLDNDAGSSGAVFFSATNVTHFRAQEIGGVWTLTRFSDAGAAIGSPFTVTRSNGKVTIGENGTALTRIRTGTATLVAGTVTVADTTITASSVILITSQVDGGTPGWLRISARSPGASFTISSSVNTDTSTVGYGILEP
jgi:hypothetical protein